MTPFFRLSGAGNDFIALAEPQSLPSADQIRSWCRRGVGLGADGLLIVRRCADKRQAPTLGLEYFNADGGPADLCLNGARCAARLADHLGWTHGSCTLDTAAGLLGATADVANDYVVEAPLPSTATPLVLNVDGHSYEGWSVTVGVPHFVVFTHVMPGDEFPDLAGALRHHPDLGPAGGNVDFAVHAPGAFGIRSFERGVEAETLACGTGALAVAAAALEGHQTGLPMSLVTRSGFTLEVLGTVGSEGIDSWSLKGDARIVAAGHILPDATP
ncbi:MAG: diaminopimelate epimerase [Acidobacteriota bacterium]|nr:diaminopimelate epimerase [Acidobacteriota bacterium]